MAAQPSFASNDDLVMTESAGQRAHRNHIAQSSLLAHQLHTVRPGVWCLVGNGLSNQTFIDAPQGIIAIDTGESNQEMAAAIRMLRTVTDRPIAAVMYTHFHYVTGTEAVFAEAGHDVPVYGHAGIADNRARVSSFVGPMYGRGLVQQFAINLPDDGPDGLVNVGLGRFYRNREHAPFTVGFVPPTYTFAEACELDVAGLRMSITPTPSDADDSITIWIPSLDVCVHNIVWPTLFNIFAIRGETYRDPLLLLNGLDHVLSLHAEHLVATHGPPLSGRDDIHRRVTRSRDAIQYLWDHTVRLMNQGFTADYVADAVRLPESFEDDYLTAERYGVAEHHVRQILAGVRGWFDGDTAKLFPAPPHERLPKLVAGFGGRASVEAAIEHSMQTDDVRWACELATWLTGLPDSTQADRNRLADILRIFGYRSPAANIRNWCLTAARDLDETASLDRHRTHRIRRAEVVADPRRATEVLRVMIDPERAADIDCHVRVSFTDHPEAFGMHLRHGVLVMTPGSGAAFDLQCSVDAWAGMLSGAVPIADLTQSSGEPIDPAVRRALGVFDFNFRATQL
jgi:alkyl sulfatase BDS1-like metallo-beta-lactamase superfamily hydrolase